ncbi:MAG: hypothetical protein Q8Q25_02555 [bacterium]|nr:hypothetical protein [bacterium]
MREEKYPPSSSSAGRSAAGTMIVRKDFFKNVVGMDEPTFRKTFGWDGGKLQKMTPEEYAAWVTDPRYPRREAISRGEFTFYTVKDLDKAMVKLGGVRRPSFEIRIYDPRKPELTDIRALQADPANKNAAFQLASTFFGPLEGGMYKWSAELTHMLEAAAQGEEANISAAGAAIWRKYFMPTFAAPAGSSLPGYYYLLENLKPTINPIKFGGESFDIDRNTVAKYKYNPNDIKKVGIGLHDNVLVTSGYGPVIIGKSATDRRPNPNDTQEQIPLNKNQTIAQIFTSAYNLVDVRKGGLKDTDPQAQFAQMLLEASYEGTLKAAYVAGRQRVFLTLMGGGAFLNDMKWIANAITKPELVKFIRDTGMQVILLYRPDPRKQPTRNVDGDIAFLKQMQDLANTINGTRDTLSPDVITSIRAAYGAAPAAPVRGAALKFSTLCKRRNSTIGWLTVDGDAVLIRFKNDPAPTIDSAGKANFIYINPDVPSDALPKGLYFWKTQNSNPEIGNHRNKTAVRHQSTMRDFRYSSQRGYYVDDFNNTWDATKIRSSHPFTIPSPAVLPPVMPAPRPGGGGVPAPMPMPRAVISEYHTMAEFLSDPNPHQPSMKEATPIVIDFENNYVHTGLIGFFISYDDLRNEDGSRLTPAQRTTIVTYLKRVQPIHADDRTFRLADNNQEVLATTTLDPNPVWKYVHRYLKSKLGF